MRRFLVPLHLLTPPSPSGIEARTVDPVAPNSEDHWKNLVRRYQKPSWGAAAWQLTNSVGGYLAVWAAMYFTLSFSYWLTALLAVLAGGLLVRVFIIFHDCGHGSFFGSKAANDATGFLTGLLTFTPYVLWKREHAQHHATAGDLDQRGFGDVPTMTVNEYLAAPWRKRMAYRVMRNPVFLFGLAPLLVFFGSHRFSTSGHAKDESSVLWTNLSLAAMVGGMMCLFGWLPYLVLQVLIMGIAGSAGTWLFYIQHQFEGVHWERTEEWDFADAALKGSSFYRLPRVLQWFSGNIGYHHIHHLSPRIPNYNLERCHEAETLFNEVPAITLLGSLASLRFRLWDEEGRRLVGFGELAEFRARKAAL
jgi:omega-6 fatty acid desaturase (delta-12 desaturase)